MTDTAINVVKPYFSRTEKICHFSGKKIIKGEPHINILNLDVNIKLSKCDDFIKNIENNGSTKTTNITIGEEKDNKECYICKNKNKAYIMAKTEFRKNYVCNNCTETFVKHIQIAKSPIENDLEYWSNSGFQVSTTGEIDETLFEDASHEGYCFAFCTGNPNPDFIVKPYNINKFKQKLENPPNIEENEESIICKKSNSQSVIVGNDGKCIICNKKTKKYEARTIHVNDIYKKFICKRCSEEIVEDINNFVEDNPDLIISSKLGN